MIQKLTVDQLYTAFSINKNVAFITLTNLNPTDYKDVENRLEINLDVVGRKFYKVFDTKKEMVDFILSFRSNHDLEIYYICGYSNGKFVQENT